MIGCVLGEVNIRLQNTISLKSNSTTHNLTICLQHRYTEWTFIAFLCPVYLKVIIFQNFCNKLSSFSTEDTDYYRIRRDLTTNQPEVKCFLTSMNDFLKVSYVLICMLETGYWLRLTTRAHDASLQIPSKIE